MAEYTFVEAFCLMWYACDQCGHHERFWNSRDGVTPFALGCPSCGNPSLRHVQWVLDERAPDHKPHPGQGIFRDGTPDDAAAIMSRRLDKCVGTQYEVDDARRAELIASARTGTSGEFVPCWPMFERYAEGGSEKEAPQS